ncbi:MAG: hypothetical protein ACLUNZ_01185 [Evtepia sp.]
MVYALLLGIADKVAPQLRRLYPDLQPEIDQYARQATWAGYYNHVMYNAYERERQRRRGSPLRRQRRQRVLWRRRRLLRRRRGRHAVKVRHRRRRDWISGSAWCVGTLVHYGLLAAGSPHSSASRPPSPSGKALATPCKLECCHLLMIYRTTIKAFPWGEGGPGEARVG